MRFGRSGSASGRGGVVARIADSRGRPLTKPATRSTPKSAAQITRPPHVSMRRATLMSSRRPIEAGYHRAFCKFNAARASQSCELARSPTGRLNGAVSARPLLRHLGAVACLTILVVAYTWPLLPHLGTHFPVRHAEGESLSSDQLFTGWILAHDVRRLLHDPLHIFESNNMHPFRHTLAYAENLIGVGALVIPVELVWRNPVLDHNAATLFCLVMTGWGLFLLVYELTGSAPAALVAGALRIYSPAVWVEIPVLQMIAGQWVPIALFAFVRLLRTGAFGWTIALAFAVAIQMWSSLHQGLFLAFGL